jgi:hypothetical protein
MAEIAMATVDATAPLAPAIIKSNGLDLDFSEFIMSKVL